MHTCLLTEIWGRHFPLKVQQDNENWVICYTGTKKIIL